MTANARRPAGPARPGRKVATGLAGVGSAAAIVGAGIAALATGAAPPAAAHEGPGGMLTATLTANPVTTISTNATAGSNTTAGSNSTAGTDPTTLPLATQTGVAPPPLGPTGPVTAPVAHAGDVTAAFGGILTVPTDPPPAPVGNGPVFPMITDGTGILSGGSGTGADQSVLANFNLFQIFTPPPSTKIDGETANFGGSLTTNEPFSLTSDGLTSSLLPAPSTGGLVLPSSVSGTRGFELDPQPVSAPPTVAAEFPGLGSGLDQAANNAALQQIDQSLNAISNIQLPQELAPQPGFDAIPGQTVASLAPSDAFSTLFQTGNTGNITSSGTALAGLMPGDITGGDVASGAPGSGGAVTGGVVTGGDGVDVASLFSGVTTRGIVTSGDAGTSGGTAGSSGVAPGSGDGTVVAPSSGSGVAPGGPVVAPGSGDGSSVTPGSGDGSGVTPGSGNGSGVTPGGPVVAPGSGDGSGGTTIKVADATPDATPTPPAVPPMGPVYIPQGTTTV